MRRALALVAGMCFVVVLGCSGYETRLEQTLADMRYRKRLDDNLNAAPTKGALEKHFIYVRPPKGLQGPTKTFTLTVVEPGRFDLENSFINESTKESMHVLARVDRPKSANTKKPSQPEPARGDFTAEVIELVRNVYGAELDANQLKAETKAHGRLKNTYRTKTLDLTAKQVQLFLYGDKNTPYKVALIFEYPKEQHTSINPKIGLCLESFAVGDVARRTFSSGGEPEGGGEGAEGPAPPI
jgi:hypothetical protein